MEVYVKFKPCHKSLYLTKFGFDRELILPELFHDYQMRFVDGKCDDMHWSITKDYKFVYGYYNMQPTYFRITNISSKPFVKKDDKIKRYKKLKQQIDELILEKNKLLKYKE